MPQLFGIAVHPSSRPQEQHFRTATANRSSREKSRAYNCNGQYEQMPERLQDLCPTAIHLGVLVCRGFRRITDRVRHSSTRVAVSETSDSCRLEQLSHTPEIQDPSLSTHSAAHLGFGALQYAIWKS